MTRPWLAVVLVCGAMFMATLDTTAVNVALPSIQADLGMSQTGLQWVVGVYVLLFGGFLMLGGRSGDLFGHRRVFLFGLVVFTVASLLDGLARNAELLIGARALQGLGGACLAPTTLAIVSTMFTEPAERARAIGFWSSVGGVGGSAGLLLGGVLTDGLSWRWIFFVNVPVGALLLVLVLRLVPARADVGERERPDALGAVTVTGGLVALVYAIVGTDEAGWASARTLGFGGLALALLGAFVLVETRIRAPLVRLGIFAIPTLRAGIASMVLVVSVPISIFFLNTQYMQRVLGYSPFETGLAFLPYTLGFLAGAWAAQRLVRRSGLRRANILLGWGVAGVALLWLTRLPVDGTYAADLLPSIAGCGLGMGLSSVPLAVLVTGTVPAREAGLAGGLFTTAHQLGNAVTLAIVATVAAQLTSEAVARPGRASGDAAHALVRGFGGGFAAAASLVAVAGFLLVALLRARHLDAVRAGR